MWVVNLYQLKEAHCNISYLLKFDDLSLIFCLCTWGLWGSSLNVLCQLHLSPNCGELQTFILGPRLLLIDFLFEKVFDTKFLWIIPFLNSSWPIDFEVSFKQAKKTFYDLKIVSSSFGPLSFYYKYHIKTYIIDTTLIPRKGFLSNITCWDVFVLYYTVKKLKINWANLFHEYILKSVVDARTSTILCYRLLITKILPYYSLDLSTYSLVEVSSTYDSRTFWAWATIC